MPFEFVDRNTSLLILAKGVIHLDDAQELRTRVGAHTQAHPDQMVRFLCDCREFKIYAPLAADALLNVMRRDNMLLARAAFVVGEGAGALQLKRMVREAGSDRRRVFAAHELAEAERWLQEP